MEQMNNYSVLDIHPENVKFSESGPIEIKDGKKAIYMDSRESWRQWLKENGEKEKSVWLIFYHKDSSVTCVDRIEATEEALCFGWIDSLCKKRDKNSYYLTFTPRNPKRNNWSDINIDRAERLIREEMMTKRGLALIDLAKEKGKWSTVTEK